MKNTHRLAARLVAVSSAAAAVVCIAATGASAVIPSYTPTRTGGAGNVTFTGTAVSFKDIPANQTLTCTVFNLTGPIINNGVSRAPGANAGSLTTLTSSGCTNPIAGATTVTPIGTWGVAIDDQGTAANLWKARLTNVTVNVVAAGCQFQASGTAKGIFNDNTTGTGAQVFDPDAGPSGLKISTTPVGAICPLIGVELGDDIEVNGTWKASPNLDIATP
jgi:hypothetical protein